MVSDGGAASASLETWAINRAAGPPARPGPQVHASTLSGHAVVCLPQSGHPSIVLPRHDGLAFQGQDTAWPDHQQHAVGQFETRTWSLSSSSHQLLLSAPAGCRGRASPTHCAAATSLCSPGSELWKCSADRFSAVNMRFRGALAPLTTPHLRACTNTTEPSSIYLHMAFANVLSLPYYLVMTAGPR